MKFDNIGTYRKQKTNQQGGKKNEQKICQHAESRGFLHTHTHTHTHTDSLITSLKQIGTICLAISLFTIPNFTFATNIPTTNPGCTTTVLGAQNIANGSAALEPDFSANTINTTWYSNGEQLTGNNIPGTCRYDAALTPPTPAARPGYVFGGWTLRVPAAPVVANCGISELNVYTVGSAYAAKKLNGGSDDTDGGATAATYGITQAGEFGVTFSYGKITGIASCNSTAPERFLELVQEAESCYCEEDPEEIWRYDECQQECNEQYSLLNMWASSADDDFVVVSNTFNSNSTGQYCWCRVTGYTPSGGNQCNASSLPWVFAGYTGFASSSACASNCASVCADRMLKGSDALDADDASSSRYYLYGHTRNY